MNGKRKSDKKIIILTAAALIAAVCGLWLLLSPRLEQERIANIQDSMIEDLMRDIQNTDNTEEEAAGISEPEVIEETEVDSNIEDNNEFENDTFDSDYDSEPEPLPIISYTPVFSDHIPDNAFPDNVTGIGILTIESIDLRLPIAEGIEDAALRIAPGRVPQTAQIGDIGNAVIAGHRNYTFGSMFNRLGEMEIGDIVQYQARNGELMEFIIFEIAVIEPEDQIAFLQPLNESIITLYTCTPIREATHRLIIRAQRIS